MFISYVAVLLPRRDVGGIVYLVDGDALAVPASTVCAITSVPTTAVSYLRLIASVTVYYDTNSKRCRGHGAAVGDVRMRSAVKDIVYLMRGALHFVFSFRATLLCLRDQILNCGELSRTSSSAAYCCSSRKSVETRRRGCLSRWQWRARTRPTERRKRYGGLVPCVRVRQTVRKEAEYQCETEVFAGHKACHVGAQGGVGQAAQVRQLNRANDSSGCNCAVHRLTAMGCDVRGAHYRLLSRLYTFAIECSNRTTCGLVQAADVALLHLTRTNEPDNVCTVR